MAGPRGDSIAVQSSTTARAGGLSVLKGISHGWRINVLRAALVVAILAAWQLLVSGQNIVFFGQPSQIIARLIELFTKGTIWPHIQFSLTALVTGYALGATVGLILGFVLGRSKFLSDLFQPFILMVYSIPKIALAPLFIIWLGLGMNSKIAYVMLSAFFLVFFNTFAGMLSVNEEMVNLARIMGTKRWQVIRHVILPAASPYIFIGLKTAVPYSVIGMVVAEFIGSNKGLGFFILYAAQTFDSASLFAGIFILVGLVYVANVVLTALEGRVLRWRPVQEETAVQA